MSPWRLQLVGWVLFTVSGVFFFVGAVRDGDALALGAAVTWLVGVVFFLLSYRPAP